MKKIKLAIIGAVILGGVIIFSNEINQLLPEFSTNIDSAKTDLEKITDDTIQNTQTTISDGGKLLSNQIQELGESALSVISFGGILGDTKKVNSESTEHTTISSESSERHATVSTERHATESTSKTNPTSSRDSSPTASDSSPTASDSSPTASDSAPTSSDSSPTTIVTKTQTKQTFETLSLKTTQQPDDTVMLHYEDTSGKTISVTVILRTTEKDLFIGTFYSSMFETSVNDATKTSYFIDMIVEHEEYGTIVSSVFNPVDTPETIINGVFSQS